MVSASRLAHARDRAVVANIRFAGTGTKSCAKIGWLIFRVARFVNWCGHSQELIPVPDDDEWVRLVPVLGTAR